MRQSTRRNVFPLALVLLALAVHGPLLLSGLPGATYDGNTHMFLAAHYARDWFQPWNEQWYGGFSQTTYPPLAHQWVALLSFAVGTPAAYLLVQLVALLLIPIGVLRYARLWVEERAARYAAVGSIFLGSLALLVYQAGQLPMTVAAALLLNALPFVHQWVREGKKSDLWKGLALLCATAATHHVTMLFGIPLFAAPVLWQAIGDDRRRGLRVLTVVLVAAAGMALVVLPFLLSPQVATSQAPIPHASRANYLLAARTGLNFWIIPMGALLLVLPFALWRGARRAALRPLLCGWSLTLLLGLGGTTMVAPVLLGDLPRALTGVDLFQVLTFERFTFWATLMMLPIVGSLVLDLGERFRWPALAGAGLAALLTCGVAVGWAARRVMVNPAFDVQDVVSFLAQPEHARYRYLTLGFGNEFPLVARQVSANAIDGDYNSARLLPELTASGAGSLDKAKYFAGGLPALRQVLARANEYGLKYVFVHDRYYEPLLSFSGWRRVDSYDGGAVTVWEKDGVPPAKPLHLASVPRWQGIAWGTLPLFSSLLALGLIVGLRERRRDEDVIPVRSEAAAAA